MQQWRDEKKHSNDTRVLTNMKNKYTLKKIKNTITRTCVIDKQYAHRTLNLYFQTIMHYL